MGRRLLDGRKLQHVCRWRMKDIGQALGAEEVANMIEHCCSFTVRDGVQAVLAMCVWRRGHWTMVRLSRSLGGGLHQHLGNAHVLNREEESLIRPTEVKYVTSGSHVKASVNS